AYPYAVDRQFLGVFGFAEMIAFRAVFFVAFVYMVARGALDWGPLQRRSVPVGEIPAEREGVKLVGLEGRAPVATGDEGRTA
ncbi:MAG: NADH-quinone oxidoreductase subunit A, partial [Actinomycetota bacterium]